MKKQLTLIYGLIFVLIFGSTSVYSQIEKSSAPVNWQLYSVSGKNVSVMLPKMPILISWQDVCSEIQIDKYAVYSKDVIYGLNIYSRLKRSKNTICYPQKNFNEKSFYSRLEEVKTQQKSTESKKIKINNFDAEFIKGEFTNYWLINNFNNDQWIELWTANSDENLQEVKNYLNSLKLGDETKGIEIKDGADSVLGDAGVTIGEILMFDKLSKKEKENVQSVKVVVKTNPTYTDKAREKGIKGEVVLRITFLENGGIGAITPTKELPFGLTEQSINVAKKLVFIPAKKDGKNITIEMSVVYKFTIY